MSNDVSSQEKLAPQFQDLEQQSETASLGMWIFLATEVLFFGGLFEAYAIYRYQYPLDFALAAKRLDVMIATVNTAILLFSSYLFALAVDAIQAAKPKRSLRFLIGTWLLGLCFLSLKSYEYYSDGRNHIAIWPTSIKSSSPEKIFYFLYYTITGLHALHMIIGLSLLVWLMIRFKRDEFSREYYAPLEVTALYWHFIDIAWIFIYPLFYLLDRHT